MKRKITSAGLVLFLLVVVIISCQKGNLPAPALTTEDAVVSKARLEKRSSLYNLNVVLFEVGCQEGNAKHKEHHPSGFIEFRQDPDPAQIISLKTALKHLDPNREYLLQRAVDQVLDGNCTGIAWLTLGKGLVPQSILTDEHGNGKEDLWRDVSAVAPGTAFDIHFQVIDAQTLEVVLTSDCKQYTVL